MRSLQRMYQWVKETREVLFTYCESLPQEIYHRELENFGGASIRNLHLHVADCYWHWLGRFALQENIPAIDPKEIITVAQMRDCFRKSDEVVAQFFDRFGDNMEELVSEKVKWQEELFTVSAMWLFTHTLTHEFHHKGQIVSIGRQLGYIPPDSDLIVPEVW